MTLPRFLIVAGVAATLVACGDEAPPPAAAPAPKPKPAAVVAAPVASADGGTTVAEAQQPFSYNYNPVGKRDPFRSPVADKAKDGPEEGGGPLCPEPLCQFDLEQLVLVAVVSGDANPVAMLEDPTRTGHIIRRNGKVGKAGGRVSQILRDCIVVTEYYLTPDGKKNPNKVNICVKKEATVDRAYDLLNNKAVE